MVCDDEAGHRWICLLGVPVFVRCCYEIMSNHKMNLLEKFERLIGEMVSYFSFVFKDVFWLSLDSITKEKNFFGNLRYNGRIGPIQRCWMVSAE